MQSLKSIHIFYLILNRMNNQSTTEAIQFLSVVRLYNYTAKFRPSSAYVPFQQWQNMYLAGQLKLQSCDWLKDVQKFKISSCDRKTVRWNDILVLHWFSMKITKGFFPQLDYKKKLYLKLRFLITSSLLCSTCKYILQIYLPPMPSLSRDP